MPTLMDAIPPEMRELQRWVCAHTGSKRPMRAFAPGAASVSRPDTWGDFDEAADAVGRGVYEYVGFVFAGDGLVGIDIDHALDEDGMPSREAAEALSACGSYAEVSKSGDGLHIICRASLPWAGRNNRRGWEMYQDKRYFVLTGAALPGYTAIADAQEGVDMLLGRHFADAPDAPAANERPSRIWDARWRVPGGPTVQVEPGRERVGAGGRHLAMVSYCGQLRSWEHHPESMLGRAMEANERWMDPPLPYEEVRQICESVGRYRR